MKIFIQFAFVLILLSSCTFEEDVIFEKINNVKLTSVEDGMVNLTAEAYFFNPNDIGGKLKSIDLEVFLTNNSLARISQQEHFSIKENSSFSIPFKASFAMEDIQKGFLDNLMSIVTGKKLKLRFKGEIKVSTWGFTQTVPVDYYEEVKL
jgi:LEA14-like dessication related protein